MPRSPLASLLLLAACAAHPTDPSDGDAASPLDASATDAGPHADASGDGAGTDGSTSDATSDASAGDASAKDASASDASAGDGSADGGGGDASLLGPPCTHGAGFVAWSFHYDGSTSAITDVYSLPDSSNWEAVPAYSTSFVDALHGGGIEIASGNWILIRFSVVGLSVIHGATLSVYGRSYDTTASGSFDGWSPLYGDVLAPTNSVSNAWPYAWTSVDYSQNVRVGDAPGLTGIRLYSGPSSDDLVIHTVELCIDGE